MRKVLFAIIALFMTLPIFAQTNSSEIEINYITEGQYNFRNNKFNWANLLHSTANISTKDLKMWDNGFFNAEILNIYSSSKHTIANDLQGFSNIDAGNMLLGIYVFGYTHNFNKTKIFGGLGNLNSDYFITPYTSSFINSSYGMFPTLSANFPMADYPYSAMSIHVENYLSEHFTLKNSIYNGVVEGYDGDYKMNRLFRIAPIADGLLSVNQLEYKSKIGYYDIGFAYHTENKIFSLWANIEQRITKSDSREIGLLFQGGYTPASKSLCTTYFGVGGVIYGLETKYGRDHLGLAVNRAKFKEATETAIELNFAYNIGHSLSIHPNMQYILTGNEKALIGLLRVSYTLNVLKKRENDSK